MTFENMDTEFEPGSEEAGPPPEESSNRPFLFVAGILGGIMLLSLIAIVAFALARPLLSGGSNRQTQAAEINLKNTEVARAVSLTEVAVAALATPSPTEPPPTATPAPTNTLVVAQQVTNTPLPTTDPRTATVSALLTQAAEAQKTEPAATPTQLPTTGFADDVGAPGLLALAVLLVVVIFLSRRLRTAS